MRDKRLLMDALDYWRLCDEISVIQATLLIVGEDPSKLQDDVISTHPSNRPAGYDAAEAALINAIRGKRLPAKVSDAVDEDGSASGTENWQRTTVTVEDLRTWLKSRGF